MSRPLFNKQRQTAVDPAGKLNVHGGNPMGVPIAPLHGNRVTETVPGADENKKACFLRIM